MAKRAFTTRLDEDVLAIAQRIAEAERRSVTSVIEVAVIDYAQRRGKGEPSSLLAAPVAPRPEDTMQKIAERRSAAARGRRPAERAMKRAGVKPIA